MSLLNKNHIASNFKLPNTNTLVFVDGIPQPQLSDACLNSMLKNQTLKIPKTTKIAQPIHLLFLASQNYRGTFDIIAENGSYTTIIEEYASINNQNYTSDISFKIIAKTSSEIVHYKLQTIQPKQSCHQAKIDINQQQNSKITSIFINHGLEKITTTLAVKLMEKNASYSAIGVDLLQNSQTMQHHILIEHLVPNCTSNVLFKSIIDNKALDNFACKVIVHPHAYKTIAHVVNKNLLLSETATANTAPELEVYVDDVICTHGATVGQLNQEALFYLRSRGIAKNTAIKMLIAAFIQEITAQFSEIKKHKRLQKIMEQNGINLNLVTGDIYE